MKSRLTLLLLVLLPAFADAQLFRRRDRDCPTCPQGQCSPLSSAYTPPAAADNVPDWAIAATCRVDNWNVQTRQGEESESGTGGICGIDHESGKAYVMTCKHVVPGSSLGRLIVTLHDGTKKDAAFLGYSADADVSLLEIDAVGVTSSAELYEGEISPGQEVYQVGYGYNASNRGTVNKRAGTIVAMSGNGYTVNFTLISGDSGSPIFDARTRKIIGIGWGHDADRQRKGEVTGPQACRNFFLACLKKKNRSPPAGHTKPPGEVKPTPAPVPKPTPAVDLSAIEARLAALEAKAQTPAPTVNFDEVNNNISQLTKNMSSLTQISANQARSIDDLAKSVSSLNDRVGKLEAKASETPVRLATRIEQIKSP